MSSAIYRGICAVGVEEMYLLGSKITGNWTVGHVVLASFDYATDCVRLRGGLVRGQRELHASVGRSKPGQVTARAARS
jgi:hypothetical protein